MKLPIASPRAQMNTGITAKLFSYLRYLQCLLWVYIAASKELLSICSVSIITVTAYWLLGPYKLYISVFNCTHIVSVCTYVWVYA